MDVTLIGKAKARRILALNGLSSRRVRRDIVEGFRFLPPVGHEQIGALFASSRSLDRNIFVV